MGKLQFASSLVGHIGYQLIQKRFLKKPEKVIENLLTVIGIQEKVFDTIEFLGTCAQQNHTGLIYQKCFGLHITKISALKSDK